MSDIQFTEGRYSSKIRSEAVLDYIREEGRVRVRDMVSAGDLSTTGVRNELERLWEAGELCRARPLSQPTGYVWAVAGSDVIEESLRSWEHVDDADESSGSKHRRARGPDL